jgi:integrase
MARDLPAMVRKQRLELLRRGRSPHTVEIYNWGVQTLIKHIGDPDGQIVNRDLLESWQDSLIDRLSVRSRSLAATGVRQLIKWAADRDEPLCDARLERAIVGIKVNKKQARPLHPNDLIRLTAHLIERCDPRLAKQMGERRPTLRDLRDRALFHYIMGTGGRVSEILQVHRASFEREVIRQKGGGPKEFVCQPGVAGLIHHYLAARTDDLPWLWIALPPGKAARQLDPAGVLQIWARLCGAYMIPRFTTHQLRHTAATALAERGHDPLTIATFLGHVDTRSVHVYAKVSGNRLSSARADLDIAI